MSLSPIVKSIDLATSPEHAFEVFVQRTRDWWPMHSHSRARAAANERTVDITIEPRVGGRFYETLEDGRVLEWGDVLAFAPPSHLTLSWRLGRPAELATTVHVQFEPTSSGCRVTLTHSDWERMIDAGGDVRGGYDVGWDDVFARRFRRFAGALGATPVLFGLPASNLVWAVRIVAQARGRELRLEPSYPHSAEVLGRNPLGKIPCLEHGPVVLAESVAIATYLDELGPGPRLTPQDPIDRAEMVRWLSLILTEFDPVLIRRLTFAYLFPPQEGFNHLAVADAVPRATALLDLLARSLPKDGWLAGGQMTLADAFMAPVLMYTEATPEGAALVAERLSVADYLAKLRAQPSIAETAPEIERH